MHVLIEKNVVRLDVAMEEPYALCRLETLGDFEAYTHHKGRIKLDPRGNHAVQLVPRDKFHLQVGTSLLLPERINLRHMRMIQLGSTLRFVAERLKKSRIIAERLLHHLDGDLAPEGFILCKKHRAHSASTEPLEENKVSELRRHINLRTAGRTLDSREGRQTCRINNRLTTRTIDRINGIRTGNIVLR